MPRWRASAVFVGSGELVELLAGRLGLVPGLSVFIRHAIHDLARLLVGQVEPALLGGAAIPFRQAVAAEAREVHQVDVLHVGALAKMLHQAAEGRRFQLDAGLVVHGALLRGQSVDRDIVAARARRQPAQSAPSVAAISQSTISRWASIGERPAARAAATIARWRWALVPRARMVL